MASTDRDTREIARAIYGTILVTALVAGLSEDDDVDAWQILVSITATTIVFWAAHAYAEVLSVGIAAGQGLSRVDMGAAFGREWPMVKAGAPAGIALALASLGVYSTETGVTLAIGLGVGALFAWGIVLGRAERAGPWQTLVGAVVNGAFGLVIVALKAFVH